MLYICLYHLTSAEDTFENLFWLHRYANDLLSPLFMPAGTPLGQGGVPGPDAPKIQALPELG